eukprot:TRINITY_DN18269_c0_g1_i1.p1 TRINITY_DN18269_c0_g1~~TRINITY_DN18269_c0_g1_i1.p1  ORF type:complete len:361 (+),score=51.42 TRINITY_DN18269_c0_g1_i1:87-1085(+)
MPKCLSRVASLKQLLSFCGFLVGAFKLNQLLLSPLWHFYLRPATSFAHLRGDWAVVTGASRGLGRGYALALARRGLNVALVSRNREALEKVARECEAFSVKTYVIVADLYLGDAVNTEQLLKEALDALGGPVSVLVNNLGGKPQGLPYTLMPCYCEDLDAETFAAFLKCNTAPTVLMTSMVLQGMVRRRKGYILNVSSMNSLQACPYLSPYSAAKAFVTSYSHCLSNELRGRKCGVEVDVVHPGPVATDGIGRRDMPSGSIPDPIAFAEKSLALSKTHFAECPWPLHWWKLLQTSQDSLLLPRACSDANIYRAMDFSPMLGPPIYDEVQKAH